jgi:hypothetical protein
LTLAAIYLRRVGIESRSYAATPTKVSAVDTPPALMKKNLGVKKSRERCGDAAAAGDQQLGSYTGGMIKYGAL